MANSSDDRIPVEELAEEFIERKRRGEQPTLDEYAARYPHLAAEIREVFPALLMMENLGEDSVVATGTFGSGATVTGGAKLERLGDYRILREVGRGGMGVVYEAEQESLGRRVALKVLPATALMDRQQIRRFEREARAAARLHHTNIVPVFGVGEQDGLHYYVMQFIQGLGLDEVLVELRRSRSNRAVQADGVEATRLPSPKVNEVSAVHIAQSLVTGQFARPDPLLDDGPETEAYVVPADRQVAGPPAAFRRTPDSSVILPGQSDLSTGSSSDRRYCQSVARIGIQVAEALDYANRQGILHRDIKPSNLLLDMKGNVWVTDFGLAKGGDAENLTHTGDIVGTIRYMAPERFQGQSDLRSDIYSLGLTLYELLTLSPAFDENDRHKLIQRVTQEEPPPIRRRNPAVPRDLETIIHKASAHEPQRRYLTGAALADDLQRFVDDKPIAARRISPSERFVRWCRRNPLLAASAGLAAALMLLTTIISVMFALAQSDLAESQVRFSRNLTLANKSLIVEQRQTRSEKERAEAALARSDQLAVRLATALKDSQKQTALLAVEKGQALVDQDQRHRGMLWQARALELAGSDAPELQHFLRATLTGLSNEIPRLRIALPVQLNVLSAAFSPDGKTIVTGGSDFAARKGQAQLWDAASGKPIGQPLPVAGLIYAVEFSPDGKTVLTGRIDFSSGAGEGRLWDVATGKPIGQPMPHSGHLYAAAFSPDGKTIATAGDTGQGRIGEAHLWDAATGKPIGTPLSDDGFVVAVAFSPDGKRLLTAGQSAHVKLWDVANGKPVGQPLSHPGFIYSAAYSPDGKMIITGCFNLAAEKGEARLWNAESGELLGKPLPHQATVFAVDFSPDGKSFLTSAAGVVRLWDTETRESLGNPLPQRGFIRTARFSPDGQSLLIPEEDRTVRLWDLPRGRAARAPLSHRGSVSAIAFSPDGRTILTGTTSVLGEAQLWDALTGKPIGKPLLHAGPVGAVAFSSDGKVAVTGTADGRPEMLETRLWDATSGRPIGHPVRYPGAVYMLALSQDGKAILLATRDMSRSTLAYEVRIWEVATGLPIGQPLLVEGLMQATALGPGGQTCLIASRDASTQSTQIRLFDVTSGKPTGPPIQQQGVITAAEFRRDGKSFVTGSVEQFAQVWDALTGKPTGPPLLHPAPIVAVAFTPDGKTIATGSSDSTTRLWDADTGRLLGIPLQQRGSVAALAFDLSGTILATGGDDRSIHFWHVAPALAGKSSQVNRWVQTLTGQELKPDGMVDYLTGSTWQERVANLDELDFEQSDSDLPALSWHQIEGLRCMEAGRWNAASWHLDRQIEAQPDDPMAYMLRARVLVQTNALDRARADCAKAVALGPAATTQHWFRVAWSECVTKAQWPAALLFADAMVEGEPASRDARIARGRVLSALGRSDEAEADFRKALEMESNPRKSWVIGGSWVVGPYPEDLKASYPPEASHDPSLPVPSASGSSDKSPEPLRWRPAVLSENGYLDFRKIFDADHISAYTRIDVYAAEDQEVVVLVGSDDDVRLWINGELIDEHAQPRAARPESDQVPVKLHQGWNRFLAKVVNRTGQYELYLSLSTEPAIRASAYLRKGKLAQAEAASAEAVALAPDDPKVHLERGEIFTRRKRADLAEAEFAKAATLNPATAIAWHRSQANSAEAEKLWPLAQAHLDHLIAAEQGRHTQAAYLFRRGYLHARFGRWKQAASDYDQGLALDPSDHWSWYRSAILQLQAGDIAAYRRHCQEMLKRFGDTQAPEIAERTAKACVLSPESAVDLDLVSKLADRAVASGAQSGFLQWFIMAKGIVEYRAGRFQDAIETLRRSIESTGNTYCNECANAALAMAYTRLGQTAQARETRAEAVRLTDQLTPKNTDDLGEWLDLLICQILLHEAQSLVPDSSFPTGADAFAR